MTKKLKKVIWSIVSVVVIILLVVGGMALKLRSEFNKMTPLATGKITDDIYAIKDGTVNVFLIKDKENFIAIDAGNNPDNVKNGLKQLAINPDQVKLILLTHSDGDHVASLSLFPNARVCIAKAEEVLLNGGESRMFFFVKNKISVKEHESLAGGQEFNIGTISIKTIQTPGHTPGHMAYLINSKYLFVGDMLSLKENHIGQDNKFFHMDQDQAIKSLSNLKGLPEAAYIFSSHFGMADYHKAIQDVK